MSERHSDERSVVSLDEALKVVASSVVETATRNGLDAESLLVEMQFGLDIQRGQLAPVVFLEGIPKGYSVHRLQFTLGLSKSLTESERVRQELAALSGDGPLIHENIADSKSIEIHDGPQKEKGLKSHVETPSPRIVIPSKPVLKLRQVSPTKPSDQTSSFVRTRTESKSTEDSTSKEQIDASSRFVIFDHQGYRTRRKDGEGDPEKGTKPDI